MMSICVTLLGGDERELELAGRLEEGGFKVKMVGFDRYAYKIPFPVVSLQEGLQFARAVIAPLAGTDDQGVLYATHARENIILNEKTMSTLKPGTPFFIGKARPFLQEILKKLKVKVIEVGDMDEVAILNSIPTGEGAIQVAMEETNITIHNSQCLVIGFGRCGITLARMLDALGARVTVAARDRVSLARAWEMGIDPLLLAEMENKVDRFEIVFNTVPAMVLDQEVIQRMNPETVIIDIASSPGGTNFEAAEKRGIKARLTLSLPGTVACKTAGQILALVYPRLIKQNL